MKYKIFLLFAFFIKITIIQAQSVIGVVYDKQSKEPLAGVNVTISALNKTTLSDSQGRFVFPNLQDGEYEIQVSYIGMLQENRVFSIENQKTTKLSIYLRNDPKLLDEVTVTAKGDRREVREVKRSGVPVTVIDGSSFAGRGTSISDVLNHQLGVKLRSTGGVGDQTKINVRGLEGNRVQIYINGMPLNTPDGSFSINDIPLQFIDRVEIYKGIVPPEFGGDGLGGAINIITIDPEGGYLDAAYSFKSYGIHDASITLKQYLTKSQMYLTLYGAGLSAKNDYTMLSPYVDGLKIKRDHNKYQNFALASTVSFENRYFDEAEIEASVYKTKKQIQGVANNIRYAETEVTTFGIAPKLEKKKFLTEKLDFKLSGMAAYYISCLNDTSTYLYDFGGNKLANSGRGEIGTVPNLSDDRIQDYRYNLNFKYHLSSHMSVNLNNNFNLVHTEFRDTIADRYMKTNFTNEASTLTGIITSLSVENRWFTDKLTTVLTGRNYNYHLSGKMVNTFYGTTTEPEELNRNDMYWGYSLALKYDFARNWLVKAAYEHNYRLPKKDEVLGDRASVISNAKIEPEQADNYNIGIMFDRYYSSNSRLQVEANSFLINVQNMIQLRTNAGYYGHYNVGKAQLYGMEAEIKWDINANWYISSNITWQKSINKTKYIGGTNSPDASYNLQMPHIPILYANWMLDYRKNNMFGGKAQYSRFYYEGSFTDKYYYGYKLSSNQNYNIPTTLIHTLGMEYAVMNRRLSFALECDNILDNERQTNFNYPLPGRTFQIKIRWTSLKL